MALPRVVGFHGFMGVGEDFSPFANACNLEIVAPDLIGHGTFLCRDPSQYSLAAQLEYWFERIPKDSVLIGYSMGGRLALQFACKYPHHLKGLVLIGSTPGLKKSGDREQRKQWDLLQSKRILELGIDDFYKEWQQMPIISTQRRIDKTILIKMKSNRLAQNADGLANSMSHFGAGSMPACWSDLAVLHLPILLLVGEDDLKYRVIARRMMEHFSEGVAEYEVINGAGHCAHLEKLSETASVFAQWLKRHFS